MVTLTPQERQEAQNILNNQGTAAFYSYLQSKGDNYGRLGLEVTNNDDWQGQLANGFAEHGSIDNNVNISYGDATWSSINHDLADAYLQQYNLNNGEQPDWVQIKSFHNNTYGNYGLDTNDWFPNRMLEQSDDPAALWEDWMVNEGPADLWSDAGPIIGAGGKYFYGPFLLSQAIFNRDNFDPNDLVFAENFFNSVLNLDTDARGSLGKDLLGEYYDLPSDYMWAWDNPWDIVGELGIPTPAHKPAPPWAQDIPEAIGEGSELKCPLVLDLDGDGIELTALNGSNAVYWDIDQDGMAEATGWAGPDDGFLAMDRNGDGIIADQTELFGEQDIEGFQALALLDTNGDDVIDTSDADFSNLLIWVDANTDGYSQDGELHTLADCLD
jgi:hypothetical protein